MTLKGLPIEGLAVTSEARCAGEQHVAEFPNGYAASVFRHGDGGGYEIAVLARAGGEWDLCYDTPITDDVVECRTVEDVAAILLRISRLAPRH